MYRAAAVLLCAAMIFALLSGCKKDEESGGTLTVGCEYPQSALGAFFGTDDSLNRLVFDRLIACSEDGEFIFSGADNAVADCSFKPVDSSIRMDIILRDGICFADGEELTADDVIFSMYVLADPCYDGESSFRSLPIPGLKEYSAQMIELWRLIYADVSASVNGEDAQHKDQYTEDELVSFMQAMDEAGLEFVSCVIDYCTQTFCESASRYFDCDAQDFTENEGLAVAMSMYCWGSGALDDDGCFITTSGKSYDLTESFPSAMDFWCELCADTSRLAVADVTFESILSEHIERDYNELCVYADEGSVDFISGIEKTGDKSLSITLSQYDSAVLETLSIYIAPMHHYVDGERFDAEKADFGFEKGSLSVIRERDRTAMGTGPYRYSHEQDGAIFLTASDNFRLGKPKTDNIIIRQAESENALSAVMSGDVDIMQTIPDSKEYQRILSRSFSNGSVMAYEYPSDSYGYIGVNAERVCVDSDVSSYESKMLRRGIAILFSVCRRQAINDYFGQSAFVVEYPLAPFSWAYPDSLKNAHEYDTDGRKIYSESMSDEDMLEAAISAAKGCFAASGVKKAKYTLALCAQNEDHPAYKLAQTVAELLSEFGIRLKISWVPDENVFFERLGAGEYDLWAAAWETAAEPDMHSCYHSQGIGALNYYNISDSRLDELIIEARATVDSDLRRNLYAECCEIILDWAVEIPLYCRKELTVVSEERVNTDTLVGLQDGSVSWTSLAHAIEMRPVLSD